jgi:hypothetical protein
MRTSREEWRKRVERWKDSGLTAEQYAGELGINAKTLQFCKYKLTKPEPSARRVRQHPRVEARLHGFRLIQAFATQSTSELGSPLPASCIAEIRNLLVPNFLDPVAQDLVIPELVAGDQKLLHLLPHARLAKLPRKEK